MDFEFKSLDFELRPSLTYSVDLGGGALLAAPAVATVAALPLATTALGLPLDSWVVTLLALGAGVGIGIGLARGFGRQCQNLQRASERISQGDLSAAVIYAEDPIFPDELHDLGLIRRALRESRRC